MQICAATNRKHIASWETAVLSLAPNRRGWPGEISVRFFKVCEDASTFEDVASLANHAQRVMQLELDEMYSKVDSGAAAKKSE